MSVKGFMASVKGFMASRESMLLAYGLGVFIALLFDCGDLAIWNWHGSGVWYYAYALGEAIALVLGAVFVWRLGSSELGGGDVDMDTMIAVKRAALVLVLAYALGGIMAIVYDCIVIPVWGWYGICCVCIVLALGVVFVWWLGRSLEVTIWYR